MDERTNTDRRKQASPPPEVMIFGSGTCARKIAANLSGHGINAWLASGKASPFAAAPGDDNHWLTGIELTSCRGFAKNFDLTLNQMGLPVHQNVPAIVVAEDAGCTPNYAPYGLKPHPRVLSISQFEEKAHHTPTENRFENGSRVVFLCGWYNESHPAVARRMLAGCLDLQRGSGVTVFFMTGNLKVAANDAETLVQAAKRAGAVFLKFTRNYPTVRTLADDGFEFDYLDELTRTPFQFRADWIVVDETIVPAPRLGALAKGLEIGQDGLGFAQCDNVHRMSNFTNRRGIFVAGGSRGILSEDEQLVDADQVSLNVLAFLKDRDVETLPTVEIIRGRCARCLTCHRLCPHQAISIGTRMSVVTEACQACGICMAACPARAIEMEGVHIASDIYRQMRMPAEEDATGSMPQVMVFGCSRSAGQALALIRLMGLALPEGVTFIEVPCGGTISSGHLLEAFDAGADGVMLCTCHTDNCQSEIGNRLARKRTEAVIELLKEAGMESDRLNIASVAANMGNEFHAMIGSFVDHVRMLDGA